MENDAGSGHVTITLAIIDFKMRSSYQIKSTQIKESIIYAMCCVLYYQAFFHILHGWGVYVLKETMRIFIIFLKY